MRSRSNYNTSNGNNGIGNGGNRHRPELNHRDRSSININMLMPGGGDHHYNNHNIDQGDEDMSVISAASSSVFCSTVLQPNNTMNQQQLNNNNNTFVERTIRVVAPATLEEGYCFDVMVDEKPYTVTVPLGGVFEGDEFDVPYVPPNQNDSHMITMTSSFEPTLVPGSRNGNRREDSNNTEALNCTKATPIPFDDNDNNVNTHYIVDSRNSANIGIVKQMKNEIERRSTGSGNHIADDGNQNTTETIEKQRGLTKRSSTVTFQQHHSQRSGNIDDEDTTDGNRDSRRNRHRRSKATRNSTSQNLVLSKTESSSSFPDANDDDDDDAEDEEDDTSNDNYTTMTTSAPIYGKWRNGLFDCCDVITQATFWMSIFCIPILLAQLVTRMRLMYNGRKPAATNFGESKYTTPQEIETEISLSYNKILLSFVTVLFICNIIPVVGIVIVFLFYFVGMMICLGKNVRHSIRQHYHIPTQPILSYICCCCRRSKEATNSKTSSSVAGSAAASKGKNDDIENQYDNDNDNCCEDVLCMTCCGCCSLVQMARHTHNDKEYPGLCCTTTGLEYNAPKVVE